MKKKNFFVVVLLIAFAAIWFFTACSSGEKAGETPPTTEAEKAETAQPAVTDDAVPQPTGGADAIPPMYGICFSPYQNGQNPSIGSNIPESQIDMLMGAVAPYVDWVLTYSVMNGIEAAGPIAHKHGKKIAVGAYISSQWPQHNQQQIDTLIQMCKDGQANMAVVGNECILQGMPVNTLIGFIDQVKNGIKGTNIPVTTGLISGSWINNPQIADHCDIINVHIYPFWENCTIDEAISKLDSDWKSFTAKFPGKEIILGETGWPSAGDPRASSQNEATYFKELMIWAKQNNVKTFYFEAIDEQWKSSLNSVGPYWGIWTAENPGVTPKLKPDMNPTKVPTAPGQDQTAVTETSAGSPVFQLSAVSQNDRGCPYGKNLKGKLTAYSGGTLRHDSFPFNQDVPLPVPPLPGTQPPPTPTWFLLLDNGIENASFTFEVIDEMNGTTTITVEGKNMPGWVKQNRIRKTNQIYKKGDCGIFGFAQENDLVTPVYWIYTITGAVDHPKVHPDG